jgi:YD repeat-containing protein
LQSIKKNSSGIATGEPIVPQEYIPAQGIWQKIVAKIDSDQFKDLPDNGYVEITIGNQGSVDFYVDDIRFYPDDALIKTFYYAQDINKPITFVDENDKAMYFKYDPFGRLIEKGRLKE